MPTLTIRAKVPSDEAWARSTLTERWGSSLIACLSGLHDAALLDGFVAELDGRPAGLLTFRIDEGDCEVVTLDTLVPGHGIGTVQLRAATDLARSRGCRRIWLTTTNDNLPALRFYQRRGWDLVAVHRDAVTDWRRRLKPQIPEHGVDEIPLRHALELELALH
jgi:GNAT superfamily N-acetyltransferase